MVTRLEVGSAGKGSAALLGGVEGRSGWVWASALSSSVSLSPSNDIESGRMSASCTVSTDLLRDDPPRETLWRLRDECSVRSSKGFGRPEQGSEEIARSLGDSSIWQARRRGGWKLGDKAAEVEVEQQKLCS